ncbi:MAG: hypothetical protein EBR20_00070 [Bacteroidetes bacterium]|nr:hypothetical protein [Bacteroidota bacterium]
MPTSCPSESCYDIMVRHCLRVCARQWSDSSAVWHMIPTAPKTHGTSRSACWS